MYLDYIKERENMQCFETETGFALYRIDGKECYVQDIYIKPDYRKSGRAFEIVRAVEEIGKSKGCGFLTGSVAPKAKNSSESLLFIMACGLKLVGSDQNLVWFAKEIR